MAARLAIFHPSGQFGRKTNPFGKDVANLELFRALARHGGFDQLDILGQQPIEDAEAVRGLLDSAASSTRLRGGAILNPQVPAQAGALLRGHADLSELAWLRRQTSGDRSYSLLALVHTIAPPAMRQMMAMASVAPVHPWDALICTSPSVRDALEAMFAAWEDHLAERTGGAAPPRPHLPIVPLGVDAPGLAALAGRPEARRRRRAGLGVAENGVLALWVGRLSYFEKAFPQPMFRALQQAAETTGAKLTFAMAGWFPGAEDRGRYEGAARRHAPDVRVVFLDGNDRALVGELWAAADLFLSLADNIQETFGITPLEAMAAGLPLVVSDWDGYRATVRDGIEGFRIPTLGGPASGIGASLVLRRLMEIDSYQSYVGAVAQHTAVHVGRAAQAIAELVASPELRRRMGQAGQARVREAYDWPVVAAAYQALLDELAKVRARSADPPMSRRTNPVSGDPFAAFAGFASRAISLDMPLSAPSGADGAQALALDGDLDRVFSGWHAAPQACARVVELVAAGEARSVREVLLAFPVEQRRGVEMAIMWLAKQGLLDWPA